jgi:hypothetical protein
MLADIGEYFSSPMLRVATDDWDNVEEIIKKVLKSPAAGAGFKPQMAPVEAADEGSMS